MIESKHIPATALTPLLVSAVIGFLVLEFTFHWTVAPHAYCYRWEWGPIFLSVLGDAMITFSYYVILIALGRLAIVHRSILPDRLVVLVWLFAFFIPFCGTTHLVAIITMWIPAFWLESSWKLATGIISLATVRRLLLDIPYFERKLMALRMQQRLEQADGAVEG